MELPRSGYRQLLPHLKRSGIKIGEKRLRNIIRKFELQIRPRKNLLRRRTQFIKHFIYPNLLPEMTLDNVNQVWASDITYIRIENGFVFLAVILDLYSRKVIGWSLSKK